jgi:hypothetical protein
VSELGRGAMGIVYLAEDESLQRQVAVKTLLLPEETRRAREHEARFRQEAKAAGGLNHPNVITIHDLGREGDWLYIAMELLQGTELRDRMAKAAAAGRGAGHRGAGGLGPGRGACARHGAPGHQAGNIMLLAGGTRRSWTSASPACRPPTCAPRAAP